MSGIMIAKAGSVNSWDKGIPLLLCKEEATDRSIEIGGQTYYARAFKKQFLEKIQRIFAIAGVVVGSLLVLPAIVFAASGLYRRAAVWLKELDRNVSIYGKKIQQVFQSIVGMGKGFQGKHNSCHIVSLLFSYFGVDGRFNHLLNGDSEVGKKLKAIVTKYQESGYVPHQEIQDLRVLLL